MMYERTDAGFKCVVCGKLLRYGRGDNFSRPAHAKMHVRKGEATGHRIGYGRSSRYVYLPVVASVAEAAT